MTIHYTIQTFDNQEPPHLLKTIKIRNALALPSVNHIVNIDFDDYVVQEVRHRIRIAYKTETFTSEQGIQSAYQEVDNIVVIARKKEGETTYSLK